MTDITSDLGALETHEKEHAVTHENNQPPPPPPAAHNVNESNAAALMHYSTQQHQQLPVHHFEDFTPDLFQENCQSQQLKDDWENNAATQIVTRLAHEMKFSSRREYDIARTAAMHMSDLYKDRLNHFQQQQNAQMNMMNNGMYRRDVNFNLMMDPIQMMQNHGPNLPHVPSSTLDGLKHESGSKRKMLMPSDSFSHSSTVTKKSRSTSASRWTAEQDDMLRAAVKKFDGRNWKAIAELVPGRDHVQCLQRWKKVLRPGLVKGHWSASEDALLLQLIQDDKMHSWAMVASKIAGRTAKQCRERWSLNLDPGINKSPWTPEEDQLLLKLYEKMGGKWSEIKTEFNGRTENAVKTRYKSLIRAKAREWTQEQDAKLIELRMKYGKNWTAIKNELPGRSKNAIKVRCKTLEYDNNGLATPM